MYQFYFPLRFKSIGFLLALLSMTGCTEVRLIGAYDAKIDDGIQSITKQAATLFVQLNQNIDDGKTIAYKDFEQNYVAVKSEVKTLQIRAEGLPKYEIIKKQLVLLESSINNLYQDHKTGFVAPGVTDVATIKKAIRADFSGIELSLAAMLKLQEGLKRTKTDKPKKAEKK